MGHRFFLIFHPYFHEFEHSMKNSWIFYRFGAMVFVIYIPMFRNNFAGYYFNDTGLLVCAPFYSQPSYRILATCSLYFPTTMILMYCYGSSFHASRFRLVVATPSNSMMHSSHSLPQSASRSALTTATTNLAAMTPVATVTESLASSSTSEKVNILWFCRYSFPLLLEMKMNTIFATKLISN